MRILDYESRNDDLFRLLRRRHAPDPDVVARARAIVEAVAQEGDRAVFRFTRELDCPLIDQLGLRVPVEETEQAYASVSKEFLAALRVARKNITRFHKRQIPVSWVLKQRGIVLEQRFSPIERVGIYVPGGKAAYPSTVLMNALPATIAGVPEVVMVTPVDLNGRIGPEVLVAAAECGVTEIYRIGGAQAVAALAFGTETIRPVDKITGPGNAYVAAAKQLVFGRVGIDMIAGPTEVVVIADSTADPRFVAADLIAQAEHDQDATPICIVTSSVLAQQVELQINVQLGQAPRANIARAAFDRNGLMVVVRSLKEASDITNLLAPEHLEIMTAHPRRVAKRIRHAGAIFLGAWSTEALGDYVAGPNHTLPTSGTARFSSALNVADFMKFSTIVDCGQKRFRKLAAHGEVLAKAEGLAGHAASMAIRREKS